jgi:hypothetical protein
VGSCRRAGVSYRRLPRGKNGVRAITNNVVRLELEGRTSGEGVTAWRRDQLLQAGFTPRLAARVAADSRYDLHRLIELVERSCPPAFAVRILAPLEDAEGSA